ncbi:hypothetical protein FAIPA1_10511 [Frankia sp. AiPs1]
MRALHSDWKLPRHHRPNEVQCEIRVVSTQTIPLEYTRVGHDRDSAGPVAGERDRMMRLMFERMVDGVSSDGSTDPRGDSGARRTGQAVSEEIEL